MDFTDPGKQILKVTISLNLFDFYPDEQALTLGIYSSYKAVG